MMKTRFAPFLFAGALLFTACQQEGQSRSVAEVVKLLDTNENGHLLFARRLDDTQFLALRGSVGKKPREVFLEDGKTSFPYLQPRPANSMFLSMSKIVNGRMIVASVIPVTNHASDSHSETWWVGIDVRTGKELFRKPCHWGGRQPAVLYYETFPLDVALNEDGSFTALVGFRQGVRLQKYDTSGNYLSETDVVPAVPSSPRMKIPLKAGLLYRVPNGFLVVTTVHPVEAKAFPVIAAQPTGANVDPNDELIVVLRLDENGEVMSTMNFNFGQSSADVNSGSLRGDTLAIVGDYTAENGSNHAFATVAKFDSGMEKIVSLQTKKYPLSDDQDLIAGVAQTADGKVLVAGNASVKQVSTHSIVSVGKPFLSVLDSSAKETAFQWLDTGSLEFIGKLYDDANGPLLVGGKNPPLTHGTADKLTQYLFSIKLK